MSSEDSSTLPHAPASMTSTACSRRGLPSLVALLPPILACLCYLNADHDEMLFDTADILKFKDAIDDGVGEAIVSFWRGRLHFNAPLTYVTYGFNHSLNRRLGLPGFDLTSFLVVNVLLHAANAFLVYRLLRSLLRCHEPPVTSSLWVALAPALLFAVHPMHASSVAYIHQRRGLLATFFYLIGTLVYLHARRRWTAPGTVPISPRRGSQARCPQRSSAGESPAKWGLSPSFRWVLPVVGVLVLWWLSLGSKGLGLTLPVTLLAVELCVRAPRLRITARHAAMAGCAAAVWMGIILLLLWRWGLFDPASFRIKAWGPPDLWGPWPHFLTEARVFLHYWKLLLLPLPRWSTIDHDVRLSYTLFEHLAVLAIAVHAVVLAAAVIAARRGYTLAALGVFWFYVALIPYVLLPQREVMVEYKTYLPAIGVAMIVAEILRRLQPGVHLKWQVPAVAAITLLLAVTTLRRNVIYESTINLWSDAVAKSPDKARPHFNLANSLFQADRLDEAIAHYERALEIGTDPARAHNNLGIALMQRERVDEARRHFASAVEIAPQFYHASNNLGTALKKLGRRAEAVEAFRRAIELRPDFHEGRFNLGSTLIQLEQHDEAAEHLRAYLKHRPEYGHAHGLLAAALFEQRNWNEAVEHYERAVRLVPETAEYHCGLGTALMSLNRFDEAIKAFVEAVRLRPKYPEALVNLGTTLVLAKRDVEAETCYRYALAADAQFAPARIALGDLLRRLGRCDEAVTHYAQALLIDAADARARAGLDACRPPPSPTQPAS